MVEITPLIRQHCPYVASLHQLYLQTNLNGKAGNHLLTCYYSMIASQQGGCGFIAQNESRLLGFVCGIWDTTTLKKNLLKKYGFRLGFWGAVLSITSPKITQEIFQRLRSGNISSVYAESGYELRPIVVTPEARGEGIAETLTRTLINDAKQRGYPQLHLITEQENIAANRFYKKIGFDLTGKIEKGSIIYNRYSIRTGLHTA